MTEFTVWQTANSIDSELDGPPQDRRGQVEEVKRGKGKGRAYWNVLDADAV